MTLSIDAGCAGSASLLQAFVDGELEDSDREGIATHLVACEACRSTVREQQVVRAALRDLRLEDAPSALHARVLRGLDAVDLEGTSEAHAGRIAVADPRGGGDRPLLDRLGAFSRGALVMLPAAAAALALFVLARRGGEPELSATPTLAATEGAEAGVGTTLPVIAGARGVFPTQVSHGPDITLVSNAENAEEATVEYRDAHGRRLVDRQRRSDAGAPVGEARQHQGRSYYIGTDAQGRMHVEFVIDEVHHRLSLVGRDTSGPAEVQVLLDAGHALRSSHVRR